MVIEESPGSPTVHATGDVTRDLHVYPERADVTIDLQVDPERADVTRDLLVDVLGIQDRAISPPSQAFVLAAAESRRPLKVIRPPADLGMVAGSPVSERALRARTELSPRIGIGIVPPPLLPLHSSRC